MSAARALCLATNLKLVASAALPHSPTCILRSLSGNIVSPTFCTGTGEKKTRVLPLPFANPLLQQRVSKGIAHG